MKIADYNENGIQIDFIPGNTTNNYSSQQSYNAELERRFDIFNYYEDIKKTVSVKVHINLLDDKMINFLKSKDLQYVELERVSTYDTFWSFLLAWQTNHWHKSYPIDHIIVSKSSFTTAINSMAKIEKSQNIISQHFNTAKIYYEDLLTLKNNQWFQSNEKYIKLDTKNKISILNLTEVNEWLDNVGRSEWKMS